MAKKIRSSEHHQWAAQDGRRAVLAALMLIFVAAATLSDGKLIPDFLTNKATPAAKRASREADIDLRTGAILITPRDGNICEHRLIDNETWRIRRNGTIPCDAAVSWQPPREGIFTAQSRLEAIRDAFVAKR